MLLVWYMVTCAKVVRVSDSDEFEFCEVCLHLFLFELFEANSELIVTSTKLQ